VIYSFGDIEVDTPSVEVRERGQRVHVEPQVFDLLCYLIDHRQRMVSKIELFDQIWGGAFVGEAALTSRIKTLRQAVGDSGREQRVIRTVHGKGYQFVAEVDERPTTPRRSSDADGEDPASSTSATSPTGTVTFMFTDIERSSLLWERHPEQMTVAVPRHDALLRQAIDEYRGVVFATGGDGLSAAFARVSDAADAARKIRAALDSEAWPEPISLEVRIGLHTGEAFEVDGDYLGTTVNRAARVMSMANGGQTLLSDVTAGVLNERGDLTDLGICRIDPAMPPMRLWQLGGPTFAPLLGSVAPAPPLMRTPLIGRDADLEGVIDVISRSRLTSITGPGGAGKTTLALATANAVLASFPAGVVFVELAAASDADSMRSAVAEAAGMRSAAEADPTALATHLARHAMLLVLDNCEHLLDECAEFIDLVLDTAPDARILTTTREQLGADGEVTFPLLSLGGYAADLFVARASAVVPHLEIPVDDPRVAEICQRLDGLPLAIELAVGQLRHLGLDELLDHLEHGLDMSKHRRSRGGERHVSLDKTIAWSFDRLDDQSRDLLMRLSVFPASFDLAGVHAVGSGDPASILGSISDLVAKSLVVRRADSGRFQLLETIRAFASRRLESTGEVDAVRARLRLHVVDRARSSSRVDRWFSGSNAASFRVDLDNAGFAFDESIRTGRISDALEIVIDGSFLWRNAMNCSHGRRWIAELNAQRSSLNARDATWLAIMRIDLGQGTADHDAVSRAITAAHATAHDADDDTALAIVLHFDAINRIVVDPIDAAARLGRVRDISESTGERRLVDLTRAFAALATVAGGDHEAGTATAREAAGKVSGDGYEVFIANWVAWVAHLISEDVERLRFWTDRQREYLTRIGVGETWLTVHNMALSTAMEGGDVHERLYQARAQADREDLDSAADTVLVLAVIARVDGRPRDAAHLLGSIAGQRLNNVAHYVLYRATFDALGSEITAKARDQLMQQGREHTVHDVLDAHGLPINA
jgi:predicted ATPase/class 3 adenylate cyclase